MRIRFLSITITCFVFTFSSLAQLQGIFTDSRDGKTYKTVGFGTQTWMAENLAFNSGSGCWAYNNDQNNVKTYGYLYNWGTANKACPSGWHLPGVDECITLQNYLGGIKIAGGKMKSTSFWKSPNTGDANTDGFAGLPGGWRGKYEDFNGMGSDGFWWTSTIPDAEFPDDIDLFHLSCNYAEIFWSAYTRAGGNSVRCLRDQ
jgi:uncharacterized protein (TIGR02145 family)